MIVNTTVKSHCYHVMFIDNAELFIWAKDKQVVEDMLSELGKATLKDITLVI